MSELKPFPGTAAATRDRPRDKSSPTSLRELFTPRTIAVIGASENSRHTVRLCQRLTESGFGGEIFFVNPTRSEVFGKTCYPTVLAIGRPVDLAIIALSRDRTLATLVECEEAGARGCVIVNTGFAESATPEGREAHETLQRFLDGAAMRLIGPSSMGFINVRSAQAYVGTSLFPVNIGNLGIISQSGNLIHNFTGGAIAREIGFSHIFSTGSEADLEFTDYLDFLVDDDDTLVICGFVEGIKSPSQLIRTAERAARLGKPILLVKAGSSISGARSALAHTGSIAGSNEFYNTLFDRYAITRALTVEEMLDQATLLLKSPARFWPAGRRLGIVSISGGSAGIVSDLAEKAGLEVPELTEDTKRTLASRYGSELVTLQNPLDTGLELERKYPGAWQGTLSAFAEAENIDAVVVLDTVPLTLDRVQNVAATRDKSGKSVIIASTCASIPLLDEPTAAEARRLELPVLSGFEQMVRSIDATSRFVARSQRVRLESRAAAAFRPVPRPILSGATVDETAARQFLSGFGIAGPREVLVADNPTEVETAASSIGFPIVIKVVSSEIPHRSDAGLVRLNVTSSQEAVAVAQELIGKARALVASTTVLKVLIQQQVKGGLELLVAASCRHGPVPLVVAGMGGVQVELMADRRFGLAPMNCGDGEKLLSELRSYPMFCGYRGGPQYDVAKAGETIESIAAFACAAGDWLGEVEINPLIVLPSGQGALAVDALITLR